MNPKILFLFCVLSRDLDRFTRVACITGAIDLIKESSCAMITIPVYVQRHKSQFQLTNAYDVKRFVLVIAERDLS